MAVGVGRLGARGQCVRAVVVTVVAGLVLSACQWAQVGFGPEHRRHNPVEADLTIDNVGSLTQVWSAEVPGVMTEPIVADGRVYVTRAIDSTAGSDTVGVWVRSLSAADGATVWERQLGSGPLVFIAPNANVPFGDRLSSGFVAHSPERGCVSANADLNAANGGRPIIHQGLLASPAVTAGSVVVRASHRTSVVSGICQSGPLLVQATDLATGDQLWAAAPGPSAAPGIMDVPAVADGRVFVTQGPRLHAYALGGCGAASCSPLWSTNVTTAGEVVWGPVAGEQGQVFVVAETFDGDVSSTELIALNAASGAVLWRTDLGAPKPGLVGVDPWIAVAGGTVYVTTPGFPQDNNLLRALPAGGCGAATCDPSWTASIGDRPSAPAVAGGVVYVGTIGEVQAYDATGCGSTTCTPVATIPAPGRAGRLSISQGTLFVAGSDTVTAYAPTPP